MTSKKHLNHFLECLGFDALKTYLKDNAPSQGELDEALKWTCFFSNGAMVDFLVSYGANPNYFNQFGSTVLQYATRGRREDVIISLLRHGAIFKEIWPGGETLLQWSCHQGFLEVTRLLICEFNESINDSDHNGRKLLHLACLNGHAKIVDFLLHNGSVDVNFIDDNGWTSLHYACSDSGEDYGDIIRLLIKNGANPLLMTPNGKTALDLAYECGRTEVLIEELNMADMVHLLISVDSIIPIKSENSRNNGSVSENGLDVSFKDTNDHTCGNNETNEEIVLGVWRKILQNDDIDLMDMLRDSGIWKRKGESQTFERAQNISLRDFTKLFDDCFENGMAIYSYIKLNFSNEICNSDFKLIFECLTGLSGFDSILIDDCEIFGTPYHSIIFLAVLCGRFRLVESLLRMRQFDIVPMGLFVILITRRMKTECGFPDEVDDALMTFAMNIENLLVDVVNRIFLKDNSVGKYVTLDTLSVSLKAYCRLSFIDIADRARCTSFLSLPCCQVVLDEHWYGKLSHMSMVWRYFTTLFPPLLFLYMTITKKTNEQKKQIHSINSPLPAVAQNTAFRYTTQFHGLNLMQRILYIAKAFWSPSVKFFYHSLFHFIFLFIFAYVVVYEFHFKFNYVEILSILFVVGYTLEEIRQFIITVKIASLSNYIFDTRNLIDVLSIFITIVGFIIRCFCPNVSFTEIKDKYNEAHDETLFTARIFLMTGLLFFSVRILFILSIFPILGPKVKMIKDMLKKDMFPLLSIFSIFLVSFGVVFQGLLYPNGYRNDYTEKLNPKETAMDMFQRSFYRMFSADYSLNESYCKPEYGYCDNALGKALVMYLYNVFYVLIVNIMLVNLLIALFSNTISRIDQQSHAHWLAGRYKLVEEYKGRSIFPPPFNIFTIIMEIIIFSGRSCLSRICCISFRRAVFSIRSKLYISKVLIKFLIIQSFALKDRRHLLGPSSGSHTNGSGISENNLTATLTQLEEIIIGINGKLDDLMTLQKTQKERKETAKNVINGYVRRFGKRRAHCASDFGDELSELEEVI